MTEEIKKISEYTIEIDGIRYTKETAKWLKIPELNIEVEIEVHDKNKSWNELELGKREDELLTVEECIFLANSKYVKELKMGGSSSNNDFFIKQPFTLNKKNGYVAWFFADSDRAGLICDGNPDYRYDSLGVRFKRKLK